MPDSSSKTIGLLLNSCSGPQNQSLWLGVVDAAAQRGVNLVTLSRGNAPYNSTKETIYEMARSNSVQGLIVSCTLPLINADLTTRQAFLKDFEGIPIVSYGMALDSIPAVMVDNYQGMRDMMMHLVQDHSCRQIAFVHGPGNAYDKRRRFQAYRDMLEEYGLPFDPKLVIDFDQVQSPDHAMEVLLNQRGCQFEAVVATSDSTAIAVMEALTNRGFQIPQDIAVVGFDNIEQSQVTTPSLTTLPLRAYERGQRSVEMVLTMLDGGRIPQRVLTPTHLLVRESCGCVMPSILQAAAEPYKITLAENSAQVVNDLKRYRAEMIKQVSLMSPAIADQMNKSLVDAIITELTNPPDSQPGFLNSIEKSLQQIAQEDGDPASLQNVVSALHNFCLHHFSEPELLTHMEKVCHQARVLIAERSRRILAYRSWQAEQRTADLHQFGQAISANPHLDQITSRLAEELPRHKVPRALLVLYDTNGSSRAFWIENGTVAHFSLGLKHSIPENVFETDEGSVNLVAAPLYFQKEELGYVIYEMGPRDGDLYEIITRQLSSALQVALLLERNLDLVTKAVDAQQRAEEANQLKSRFLSVVSHEIRTPLTLLIGLSDMLINESDEEGIQIPSSYQEKLTQIYFSAHQLDGLMRDVSDLTRSQLGQLKLFKKQTNMVDLLKAVEVAGEQMAHEKGLAWQADIPPELPFVWADQLRLQQVILNLISNAVKYTLQGEVRLTAASDGAKITVYISDTGLGIPPEEHAAIFDEFHQSHVTTVRGYGGLGLGLAICRQLIQLHNGEIGIDASQEGIGSTFYFTLPASADVSAGKEHSEKKLLLFTEQPERAIGLIEHFTRSGISIDLAVVDESKRSLPSDWLSHILSVLPETIVFDFQPEWGWELMIALKSNPVTQATPVLFYSLQDDNSGGAVLDLDYIAKPIAGPALAQILKQRGLEKPDMTILIVDDDPGILEMHTAMIQRHFPGCRIICAPNGLAALAHLREEDIHLILLDLMMPQMDGFSVLQSLNEQEATRHIPVIVISAQTLNEEDMARMSQGVAGILAKGIFSPQETMNQIEQALYHRKRPGNGVQQIVRKGMAYIHQHFESDITREQIADYIGISNGHLTRCFRQEIGITPITYVNRYRVEQAKHMIDQGQMNITEIALAVGFSDSSYFTRIFKRESGYTPKAYRDRFLVNSQN